MNKELAFVLRKFSNYYEKAEFSIPEIEKREFGSGIEKKIDSRHMGFASETEFRSFLVNSTPLYISHSVAYYRFPKATPMERKGWLGADLVFDLDFETGNKYLSKTDFEKIRGDTLRLIEEFLIPDLGISEQNLGVNFSGNRGFHVHVRDPRFKRLKDEGRREIIEYVKGTGLSYDMFFSRKEAGEAQGRTVYIEKGPVPSSSGYGGKFAARVLEILNKGPEQLSRLFRDEKKRRAFISGIKAGNWSMRKITPGLDRKLREMAEAELPMRAVNIDAGVTQDAAKLIRVPDTLHGSTGLRAKTISLRALQDFEPMRDALAFSPEPMKIIALENIPEMEMGNSTNGKMEKGKLIEVPECLALYLTLKRSAKFAL